MKIIMNCVIGSLLFCLIGTCMAGDRYNYLDARNANLLRVPSHLDDSKISKYFVIKATNVQPGKTPVPPGSALERHLEAHPLQSQGLPTESVQYKEIKGEPVLWVNQKGANAYKSVRVGLAKQNIKVVRSSPGGTHIIIYDTFSTYDRVREDTPRFDIKLTRQGKGTLVRVRSESGDRINPNTARRLLVNISEGMRGIGADDGIVKWIKDRNGAFKYG